ncbi:hypothetical protein BAE44_0015386 [Dichanthelium oligosanthes]|uniref:AAA-type ATPase N-terminal domain-containing protein n=1 Tax=Dichanthelium oligosanthes TaxID=888268 RepID=A0A1E5VEM0_9POAL|nr:hypothetical protein BAE44_0015386 [Dichanthelium oligosanthes]
MPPRPRTTTRDPAAPASPGVVERFAGVWSALAGAMLVWSMLRPYLPRQLLDRLAGHAFLRRHARRLVGLLNPYLTATVAEYDGERMKRADAVGDGEEVADEFRGVPAAQHHHHGHRWFGGGGDAPEDAGRMFRIVFHQRHRDLVVDSYLPHICREGRAIMDGNRRRKLYTNGERWVVLGYSDPLAQAVKGSSCFASVD